MVRNETTGTCFRCSSRNTLIDHCSNCGDYLCYGCLPEHNQECTKRLIIREQRRFDAARTIMANMVEWELAWPEAAKQAVDGADALLAALDEKGEKE